MENESERIVLSQEEKENIKSWINHGLNLTVSLVKLDANKEPRAGFCSGFLVSRNGKLYVVSAGHGLGNGEWYFQTNVSDHTACRTALIPMNGVFTLSRITLPLSAASEPDWIDFAWCEVSFNALAADMKAKPYLIEKEGFLRYEGPLDTVPDKTIPYTYAAHNKLEYYGALGRSFLELAPTYETWMQYQGVDEATGLYRFLLNGEHKGHAHYKGASGSPIFDPEQRIVSILLKGDETANTLFGLPINQFQACIGLD